MPPCQCVNHLVARHLPNAIGNHPPIPSASGVSQVYSLESVRLRTSTLRVQKKTSNSANTVTYSFTQLYFRSKTARLSTNVYILLYVDDLLTITPSRSTADELFRNYLSSDLEMRSFCMIATGQSLLC